VSADLVLPQQYHMKRDWAQTEVYEMIPLFSSHPDGDRCGETRCASNRKCRLTKKLNPKRGQNAEREVIEEPGLPPKTGSVFVP